MILTTLNASSVDITLKVTHFSSNISNHQNLLGHCHHSCVVDAGGYWIYFITSYHYVK